MVDTARRRTAGRGGADEGGFLGAAVAAAVAVGGGVGGADADGGGHAVLAERHWHGPGAGRLAQEALTEDGGEHLAELAADGAVDEEVDAGVERHQQSVDMLEGHEEVVGEDLVAPVHGDVEGDEDPQRVAGDEDEDDGHHHPADVQHVHAGAAPSSARPAQPQPHLGLVLQHAAPVGGQEVDEEGVEDDEDDDGQEGGQGDVGDVHGRVVGLVQAQLRGQQRAGAAQVRVGHVLEELGEVEEEGGEEDAQDGPLGPLEGADHLGVHHEAQR